MNKDYYAILGVTSVASQEEIRLAYERLSVEKKIEAEEAYLVLSNPQTRFQYDKIYNNSFQVRNFDGFDSSRISRGGLIGAASAPEKNIESGLGLDIDFDDPEGILPENFSEIFQAAIKNIINVTDQIKAVQNHDDLKSGRDIFLDFSVSPLKAEKGGYASLEYQRYIYCSQCQSRDLTTGDCPKCGGAGRVMAHRRVEIKIPKNSPDGCVLQIANEGHAPSIRSEEVSGDLFVKVIIRDEI